jgi:hypothetical protein
VRLKSEPSGKWLGQLGVHREQGKSMTSFASLKLLIDLRTSFEPLIACLFRIKVETFLVPLLGGSQNEVRI